MNNNNNNPRAVEFTFVPEGIPQQYANNNGASGSRGRGRPRRVPAEDVVGRQSSTSNDDDGSSNSRLEEALIDSIDNENESPVVRIPFDQASIWVVIELAQEYFERLELSSSAAHKASLYREMLDRYNSYANTNGRRSLKSIRSKWNELVKIYRRRKDQERRTGAAPQATWPYHDKMSEIGGQMATVTPPTVYTSFMRFGNTVDNRAETPGISSSQSINPSVQQFTEAIRELSDYSYARAAPEREALRNYLQASTNFMQRFLEARECTLENQRAHNELMERRTRALERAMEETLNRVINPNNSLLLIFLREWAFSLYYRPPKLEFFL